MICGYCKRSVNNSASICPFCGEPLHRSTAKSSVMEKKRKRNSTKPFFKILMIVLLLMAAAGIAMYFAYSYFVGSSSKEYLSSVAAIQSDVKKVNDDGASLLENSGNNLPADDILKKLPELYGGIDKVIEKCSQINPPSKYSSSHKNLQDGLKYNKLIYRQLETILKSPLSPDMQKNYDQLTQYIDQCCNSYSKVEGKGIVFLLPAVLKSLPSELKPWINQKQKEYENVSSLISSFSKYFEDMSKILMEYDSSRIDMSQAIKKTQSDDPSWDELLPLIDKNTKIVSDIKTEYLKLSVPSYLKTFNKRFGSIIDEMLSYYNKLNDATRADMDFGKTIMTQDEAQKKASEIKTLYEEADKLNSSAAADYQKFTADIEGEKSKYMDPEYVMKLKPVK